MGFIYNILETNNEINLYLRTSKHPKFYVNYMVNKNRKKLRRTVDKIEDTYIPAEDIIEFIEILKRSGANSYNNIKLSQNNNAFLVDTIVADTYHANSLMNYSDNIIVSKRNIIATSVNGNIDYTEHNVKELRYKEHDINNKAFSQIITELANNAILEAIIKSIKQYLYDAIERSERINL